MFCTFFGAAMIPVVAGVGDVAADAVSLGDKEGLLLVVVKTPVVSTFSLTLFFPSRVILLQRFILSLRKSLCFHFPRELLVFSPLLSGSSSGLGVAR